MLIEAAGDSLDVGLGEEFRLTEGDGADEDFGGFIEHEGGGLDGLRRRAEGDDAMVLQEDRAGRGAELFAMAKGLRADDLGELEAGIGVGDEEGNGATADDLIGEEALI